MKSRSPLVELLAPLADKLLKLYPKGVTTADLIDHAEDCGLLTGSETGRQLSGLHFVFRAIGAVNSGKTRCSHLPRQKGVRQVVWLRGPYLVS